jgi:hypothetical protein
MLFAGKWMDHHLSNMSQTWRDISQFLYMHSLNLKNGMHIKEGLLGGGPVGGERAERVVVQEEYDQSTLLYARIKMSK